MLRCRRDRRFTSTALTAVVQARHEIQFNAADCHGAGDSAVHDQTVYGEEDGGKQEKAEQEQKERDREEQREEAGERMNSSLNKLAYKGAGQAGVRRVGGDAPRHSSVSRDRFVSPLVTLGLQDPVSSVNRCNSV